MASFKEHSGLYRVEKQGQQLVVQSTEFDFALNTRDSWPELDQDFYFPINKEIVDVESDTARRSSFHAISTTPKRASLSLQIRRHATSSNQTYISPQSSIGEAGSTSKPSQTSLAQSVRASVSTLTSAEQDPTSLCCLLCVGPQNALVLIESSSTNHFPVLAVFPRRRKHWEVLINRCDYDTYLSSEEGRFWASCAKPSRIALQTLLLRRYGHDHLLTTSFYKHHWMHLAFPRKVEAVVGLLRPWFSGFRIGDQNFERRFLVSYQQTDTGSVDSGKIRQAYNSRFST